MYQYLSVMKKSAILMLLLLGIGLQIHAQTSQKDAEAKIQQLTVFYQGAQIERITNTIARPAGQTLLNIEGLEE